MRTSLATVCLSGTLRQKLRAAASAGFDGVEVFEPDLVVAPESPEEIRDYAAALGLELYMYQPFRDAVGIAEDAFDAALARAEQKFALMDRLGTDLMLVCSTVGGLAVDNDALAANQLARLADAAARHGIRLAYEALAWGTAVYDAAHSWRIARAADRANVGVCLDTFHILSRGWPASTIDGIPGEKIFIVQLADAPPMDLDVLSWSRHHRVFPGQGGFDLVDFMEHLVASGYDGPLSLEVFNDSFRQTDVHRTAVEAMRSLLWLQDRTSRALAPSAGRDLPVLPGRVRTEGLAWAEVRGHEVEQVEVLLARLGFGRVGRHASKPVQLWEQGDARVVIDESPGAGEAPVLASLGVVVEDCDAAETRAAAMLVPAVPRIARPEEQRFPAFLAPDGTEVFFCPRGREGERWIREFSNAADAPEPGGEEETSDEPLITGIDHVNLFQPRHHWTESVLFCRAALGLEADASQDVPGPTGLVTSQVFQNEAGTVRLPLNVAPELRRGGEAQHIAFACRDVRALARRAREAGLRPLPVPHNYYEDLRARFGLPEETLAELEELDLLYDEDSSGRFLHFYTQTAGEVFFEAVERTGGYEGYGAPNAPVRLASQYALRTGLA